MPVVDITDVVGATVVSDVELLSVIDDGATVVESPTVGFTDVVACTVGIAVVAVCKPLVDCTTVVVVKLSVVIGMVVESFTAVVEVNMLLLVQRQSISVAGHVVDRTSGPLQVVFTPRAATGETVYNIVDEQLYMVPPFEARKDCVRERT